MKLLIYLIMPLLAFVSCDNQPSENAADIKSIDTFQNPVDEKQAAVIYIKDKTLYDKNFIEGLSDYNEPIKLIDNFIVTGNDTTYFPSDLDLNKNTRFTGNLKDQKFTLNVTRINLTSVRYSFQINDETKSGQASLGSLFFLASEGDVDSVMNTGYGSYEYYDNSNGCNLSIRIGIGLDDNGKQRAKVIYACDDKTKPVLSLDDCPVLRTE